MGVCTSKTVTISTPLLAAVVEETCTSALKSADVSEDVCDPKTPDHNGAKHYMWTKVALSHPAARGMQMAGWELTTKCERIIGYAEDECYFARLARESL